jgi:hypothetical protein
MDINWRGNLKIKRLNKGLINLDPFFSLKITNKIKNNIKNGTNKSRG